MQPLFTIGHSNHNPDEFLRLLHSHNITALADVRSAPYSRYMAHFNKPNLESFLRKSEIRYVFLGAELGARTQETSCYVNGKALYSKIAQLPSFHKGLERILKGLQHHRIALMCAEKDPITCHRAILVCQHLVPFNLEIAHIHGNGRLEYHENLEERLLIAHNLQGQPPNGQLSLFPTDLREQLSRAERLAQAYQKQGDEIAYVEAQEKKS